MNVRVVLCQCNQFTLSTPVVSQLPETSVITDYLTLSDASPCATLGTGSNDVASSMNAITISDSLPTSQNDTTVYACGRQN